MKSNDQIQNLMTVDKVATLITALEIIANGDPISVGLDEIKDLAQSALDRFNDENICINGFEAKSHYCIDCEKEKTCLLK